MPTGRALNGAGWAGPKDGMHPEGEREGVAEAPAPEDYARRGCCVMADGFFASVKSALFQAWPREGGAGKVAKFVVLEAREDHVSRLHEGRPLLPAAVMASSSKFEEAAMCVLGLLVPAKISHPVPNDFFLPPGLDENRKRDFFVRLAQNVSPSGVAEAAMSKSDACAFLGDLEAFASGLVVLEMGSTSTLAAQVFWGKFKALKVTPAGLSSLSIVGTANVVASLSAARSFLSGSSDGVLLPAPIRHGLEPMARESARAAERAAAQVARAPARERPAAVGMSSEPGPSDVDLYGDLLQPDHACWAFLRRLSPDAIASRVPLINRRHLGDPKFVAVFSKALGLVSARLRGVDPDAIADGPRLFLCLYTMLFGRHRLGLIGSGPMSPWLPIVKQRLDRLLAGEFGALFAEAMEGAVFKTPDGSGDMREAKAKRAVELAHMGSVSKSFGALTAGGVLPLAEEAVREKFTKLLQPNDEALPADWRSFVRGTDNAPPVTSSVYKFVLGESNVKGPNGEMMTVDTLEYVLRHLDRSSAAGVSGIDFAMLRHISPDLIRPILAVFGGGGVWDYDKRVDGAVDGALYHRETHALLISVRGLALDKGGEGYAAGREIQLRPIGIGESMRRIHARCVLLQSESDVGQILAETNSQFGVGFACGTDMVYHMVSKGLDAFVAADKPGGSAETDARNAFGSIFRAAIQRGILRHAPFLLPIFDFLYGPNATGRCYYYGSSSAKPLGSCALPDGVQQGDVYGPIFFALGMDELLAAIRMRMRDLNVDSTMQGAKVTVRSAAQGTLSSGGLMTMPMATDFVLVEAPTYSVVEAAEEKAAGGDTGDRDSLRATLSWGEMGDSGSFRVSVLWSEVRLSAEVLLAAYLDDIHCVSETYLLRRFILLLRELGPKIGLHFTSLHKNYLYIPRVFADCVERDFPDAVVVHDASPGATPADQLERAARQLAGDPRRMLISLVGIAKIMGAPLRTVCTAIGRVGECAAADETWVQQQVAVESDRVTKLFAHLGLKTMDDFGCGLHRSVEARAAYGEYLESAASLPADDPQVQGFVARYCLGTRLNCLARGLVPSLSHAGLEAIDKCLAATAAGLCGETSMENFKEPVQARVVLAARRGGVLPGAAIVRSASYLSAVGFVEVVLSQIGKTLASKGAAPWVLQEIRVRMSERGVNTETGSLTPLERGILEAVSVVNEAHCDADAAKVRQASSRGGLRRTGAAVDGAGAEDPILPLVSFTNVSAAAGRSRQMSDALWDKEWVRIYAVSSAPERAGLSEGLLRGAGAFALAVPMARPFVFSEAVYRRMMQDYLGRGGLPLPWTHHCGNDAVRTLSEATINHVKSCSQLGRAIATHDAAKNLFHALLINSGVADAVVTEVTTCDREGNTLDADVRFTMKDTGERYVIEVSTVVVAANSAVFAHANPEYGAVERLIKQRVEEKRTIPVAESIVRDSNIKYVPFVVSTNGGIGRSAGEFLNMIYKKAKANDRWIMAIEQPALESTWNTLYASTYWDMRFSVAVAATDALYQNRIIMRDETLNLPTNGRRQPSKDPNASLYEVKTPAWGRARGRSGMN